MKSRHGLLQTGVAVSADLEFKKGCNKAVDGEGMVDRLLELIAQQLKVGSHLSTHAAHPPLLCMLHSKYEYTQH